MSDPGWLAAMKCASSDKEAAMLRDPKTYFSEQERPDGRRVVCNLRNFLECAVFAEDRVTIDYFTGAASKEWQRAVRVWLERASRAGAPKA